MHTRPRSRILQVKDRPSRRHTLTLLHKHRIKSEIKRILEDKEIEGPVRNKILNALVNHAYKTALEYGKSKELNYVLQNENPFDNKKEPYVIT